MDDYTEARRAVAAYLDAIIAPRDRPATKESVGMVEGQLRRNRESAEKAMGQPLSRLKFLQVVIELEADLDGLTSQLMMSVDELEAGFVKHAQLYADRTDTSGEAFRRLGVADDVLRQAGLV